MLSLPYSNLKRYQYSVFIPLILLVIEFGSILILLEHFKSIKFIRNVQEQRYLLLSETMALCWILAGIVAGSYRIENLGSFFKITVRAAYNSIIYLGLIYFIIGLRFESKLDLTLLLGFSLITFVFISLIKMFLLCLYRVSQRVISQRKKTIIIGNTLRGKELSHYFLTHSYIPQDYLGFFDDNFENYVENLPFYLGGFSKVKRFCLENDIKEIYYAVDKNEVLLKELMAFADDNFIFLGIIPNVDGIDFNRRVDAVLYNDSRIPVITSRKVPINFMTNWYDKRIFDVIFSSFALIALSVTIFPIIALAIKISSPGPIIYKQQRPGRNNKPFWCYKFRSMRVNNEEQKQATKNDSRITKVGAFMRRTSLDELPQFYNVLIGDMSVVGPRPNLMIHLEQYPKDIKEYSLRHLVTPGITGFAQVNGYRGETKEVYLMQKRVEHDLQYIENWSFTLDLKIIAKTVYNIFSGEDKAF